MTRQPAKAPSQRQLRVGEEIRHVLAELLLRGQLRDPDLQGVTVTVTEVRISPDLKSATAFVTPLGGGAMETTVAALTRAAPFLRREMGRELRLRVLPELSFQPDRSFEEASRIDSLLQRERVQRDLKAGEPAAESAGDDDEPQT
ncbi:MAG: 30S ribosome-binding factor RbfA [Rhodovibrionaceae bacterium]